MITPEILAPAGSMETLRAALRCGADAVYAGGKYFSARNSAVNFTDDEITEAVKLCHLYSAKLYIAVNTIISDSETEKFCTYIKFLHSAGIDGCIVQDWGAAQIIKNAVPDSVIHASTQMSVHTAIGAEFLGNLGYVRIVPARECNKNTLAKICALNTETEVFVHGALCMSVSGQCYMSAVIGSRSANRGCCGQACRLPYSSCGNKNYCALSLKDLSLIPKIDELREIGVDSLKIEGRMKRPEYVASAVNELKKSLDGEKPDMQTLKGIFSRSGFTDGYFTGRKLNMFGQREKEDVVAARELIPKIHELYRNERQVHDVDIHCVMKCGQPLEITAKCMDISVTVCGDIPDKALKTPADSAALAKQLSKTGDTVFKVRNFSADIDDGLFVTAGKLNALRRNISEKLSENIIMKNTPVYNITDYTPSLPQKLSSKPEKFRLRTFCRSIQQAKAAYEYSEYIITDENISLSEPMLGEISYMADKLILSPPRFIHDEDKVTQSLEYIRDKFGINRLFCHTPDCIAIGKKLGFELHGSYTLNIFNSYSAECMKNIGLKDCVFSFEAKKSQYLQLHSEIETGMLVYGRIPLMLTVNCPIKNEIGCKNCTGFITDRTKRNLPVLCHAGYTEILNPDILYIDDIPENVSFGIVMLSDENAQQTKNILSGKKTPVNITRGLYKKGLQEVK